MNTTTGESKAYTDQRNAPVRRYLLKALAKAGLNSVQYACLLVIMDETYGWKKPNQPLYSVRKDREEFTYQHLAKETGNTYNRVAIAIRELVLRNILTQYRKPSKSKPGIFGVQSDPEKWIDKTDITIPKRTSKKPRSTSSKKKKNPQSVQDNYTETNHENNSTPYISTSLTEKTENNNYTKTRFKNNYTKTCIETPDNYTETNSKDRAIPHKHKGKSTSNHDLNQNTPYSPPIDDPKPPEKEKETRSSVGGKVDVLGLVLFRKLSEKYYAATGAPRKYLGMCRDLVGKYIDREPELKQKWKTALAEQKRIEESTRKRTYRPFEQILNRVEQLMQQDSGGYWDSSELEPQHRRLA